MYSLICNRCNKSFMARKKGSLALCPECQKQEQTNNAKKRRQLLNRPATQLTEFLVSVYSYRGDTIKRIATDLNRSEKNVEGILKKVKANGSYENYIKTYIARGVLKK